MDECRGVISLSGAKRKGCPEQSLVEDRKMHRKYRKNGRYEKTGSRAKSCWDVDVFALRSSLRALKGPGLSRRFGRNMS